MRKWMTVGMDSRLATIHNTVINTQALYSEFFQDDIERYGFDRKPDTEGIVDLELDAYDQESGTERMADPGLD